ncbi:hypothetical protein [Enterococcus sp. AZ109]|uniref:hypothetical protein n=1 Tax=Enterococcus sp. AZ109 TaxID=2774634 RepID=UPI003F245CD9
MKEIGGYFGLEELNGTPYYPNAIPLDKGRSCLMYVMKVKKISRIYLPTFLCDCVEEVLVNAGIEVKFYSIDDKLQPIFSKQLSEEDCLYLVNYYGQLTNQTIKEYQLRFPHVLVDNTQAFFQPPVTGVDTFYTCRKFFGVPDGAYLFTDKKMTNLLPVDHSNQRMEHLLGRYEENASKYYTTYQKNEELLDENPIRKMSKLTMNLLKAVPYKQIKQQRSQNFRVLSEQFKGSNLLSYQEVEGAFAYPLLVDNAIDIRKNLVKENIFLPTLWPNVVQQQAKNSLDYRFASNIIPLPCDQRYDEETMMYLSEKIQPFLR